MISKTIQHQSLHKNQEQLLYFTLIQPLQGMMPGTALEISILIILYIHFFIYMYMYKLSSSIKGKTNYTTFPSENRLIH